MLCNFILKKCGADKTDCTSPKARARVGKFSGILGIVCNLLLFGLKLTTGIVLSSVSIVADAFNNLADASSNVISFFGFKMATRPADEEHPYGHGRYEYVSALTVALLIMVFGVEILREGIEKIITPSAAGFNWILAGVLIFSIALKLWLYVINKRLGQAISSNALLATSADSRNDVITTFAVLLASVISFYTAVDLDGIMAVAVSLFILYSGFSMIKKTLTPLLGKAPDKQLVESIKRKILGYEGVLGTHDLIIHDYGAGRLFASAHIEMSAETDAVKCHDTIDDIERDFLKNDGLHMVLHLDPIITDGSDEMRDWLSACVKKIDERLTIHDLKVIKEGDETKLKFDCVTPPDSTFNESELIALIKDKIKAERPDCECEVKIDRSFAAIPE